MFYSLHTRPLRLAFAVVHSLYNFLFFSQKVPFRYPLVQSQLNSRDCHQCRSRVIAIYLKRQNPASRSQVKRNTRSYCCEPIECTATNCDETSSGIKRLEKNGPFGNTLDAEIDDTIHFEISPKQFGAKYDWNRNWSENYGRVS